MCGYEEVTIRRVCTPAHACEGERPLCELRHGLAQELANALLGLQRDLVPAERDRGLGAVGFGAEVGVARMLVADLELVALLVGLHEEAALHVEQHGQVLVELAFLLCHGDVCQRPGGGAQLVFHVDELGSVGAGAENGAVGAVLFAVCGSSAFDVAVFDDERCDFAFDDLHALLFGFGRGGYEGIASMAPARAFGFGPASPIGEIAGKDAFRHEFAELFGGVDFAEAILRSWLVLT